MPAPLSHNSHRSPAETTLVMKIGGSLTTNAYAIRQMAQVILAESLAWPSLSVVVSAMAGATDKLARACDLAVIGDSIAFRQVIAALRAEHAAVIDALFVDPAARTAVLHRLDRWLFMALSGCDLIAQRRDGSPRERDTVLVIGERLMAEIVNALLHQEHLRSALIDSAEWLITDEHFQNANPIIDQMEEQIETVIRPTLGAGYVVVTPGFVGTTPGHEPTTLGRGGSDYTATLLAAGLHADEVWMWTRVDGIMSADPVLMPETRVLDTLAYEDVRELAYFGVRVLHPRAIDPLQMSGIPMRVRNPFQLEQNGTVIRAQTAGKMRAVSMIDGLLLTTDQPEVDLSGFLAQIDIAVGQSIAGPVTVSQGQSNTALVFVVPTSEGPTGVSAAVNRLEAHLSGSRWQVQAVKVIAMFGARTAPIFPSVPILAYHYDQARRQVFVVAPEHGSAAAWQLHQRL